MMLCGGMFTSIFGTQASTTGGTFGSTGSSSTHTSSVIGSIVTPGIGNVNPDYVSYICP